LGTRQPSDSHIEYGGLVIYLKNELGFVF